MKPWLICLYSLVFFLSLGGLRFDGPAWYRSNDFAHYYMTSSQLLVGEDPYENDDFPALYESFGFDNSQGHSRATNPPALALIVSPFTLFSPFLGWLCWQGLQLLSFVFSVWLVWRMVGVSWSRARVVAYVVGASVTYPFLSHLQFGQTQLLVLAISLFGLRLLLEQKVAGTFLMGFGASLKLFTAPLIFECMRRRGIRGALEFIAGFGVPYLIFVLIWGVEQLESFFLHAVPAVRDMAIGLSGNTSLGFASYFVFSLMAEEGPVFGGEVTGVISVSALLCLLTVYRRFSRHTEHELSSFAFLLIVSTLCAPTAWPHYFVLTLPAFGVLLEAERQGRLRSWFLSLAFFFVAFSHGFIVRAEPWIQLLSALWGPLALCVVLALLLSVDRGNAPVLQGK